MQKERPAVVVVGASHGGFEALKALLAPLPRDFPVPILVVRHQSSDTNNYIISALNKICALGVQFAENAQRPVKGQVYLAPPDMHMRLNADGGIVLTNDAKVNFSRPAIDPLFESAATKYGANVLGIILTGANSDGAKGAAAIQIAGGQVIVQDPQSAEASSMPNAAIRATATDHVIWLDQIGPQLWTMCRKSS